MADLSKLRKKIKPVVMAASGSAILVAGLMSGCGTVKDAEPDSWFSGNLLPPDMLQFDEGTTQDEGVQPPDVIISGNLMPPDVQEFFDMPIPPKDGVGATDEGVQPSDEGVQPSDEGAAVDKGEPVEPDVFISGNLMPPDVMELPADDVSDKEDEDSNDGPGEADPNPESN
jgi:hypothetical protein